MNLSKRIKTKEIHLKSRRKCKINKTNLSVCMDVYDNDDDDVDSYDVNFRLGIRLRIFLM